MVCFDLGSAFSRMYLLLYEAKIKKKKTDIPHLPPKKPATQAINTNTEKQRNANNFWIAGI